ncbi:MAG: DUF4469 domain-containing protein [Bacteroidales bacterium]
MNYYLIPTKLTDNPNDCVAKVTQQEVVGYNDLIALATRRGLTLTDTEIISVMNEMTYCIIDVLSSGKAVDTPFARFRPSIGGVFRDEDDQFDPARHYIKINCLVGKDIVVDLNKIVLEKVKYEAAAPYIEEIMDYSTLETNNVITPSGAAEIKGEMLKIDREDALQGLFFRRNGTTIKVDTIIRNQPSDLIFNVPNTLTTGEYQLEIRNKINKKDANLKNYLFPQLLTVR